MGFILGSYCKGFIVVICIDLVWIVLVLFWKGEFFEVLDIDGVVNILFLVVIFGNFRWEEEGVLSFVYCIKICIFLVFIGIKGL